ncbi:MAG: hypothetical protein G01um101425_777 [Candidatus Peregrinibacteria bacterium Gr01-1014_25]|nr:MAG: hypothetical protein G01um101425_777 [Candidatus Peregrinibacteria bacterium Gr01-1014_25]
MCEHDLVFDLLSLVRHDIVLGAAIITPSVVTTTFVTTALIAAAAIITPSVVTAEDDNLHSCCPIDERSLHECTGGCHGIRDARLQRRFMPGDELYGDGVRC